MKNNQFTKTCSNCGGVQCYSRKDVLELAIKNKSICRKCSIKSQIGSSRKFSKEGLEKLKELGRKSKSKEICDKISNTLRGRKKSPKHIEKIKQALKGKTLSKSHRLKISKSCNGRVGRKGFHLTEETKYKLRLATINDLKNKNILVGKNTSRNFNPKACEFIDKLNEERGWNLQHALSGGEVELYGYFVDGYDKERNIIFEYDEPRHNQTCWISKDIIRQNNLIKKIGPSKFIRYDEQWNRLYEIV